MRKLTVKIWLTIAAFFLSATVSVANCSSNANQCTPKQLCSAATVTLSGVKIWSKSSRYSKHVSWAKQVGINCGVVEIVASCDNDPELCSVDDLCKQSVQKSGGKTGWKTSSKAADHIALAKEFGLKCGVTEPVAKKKTCAEDVRVCTAWQLCPLARSYKNGQNTWAISSSYLRYVTEAKRRGLTCGVTETVTKKKTCAEDTRECKTGDLCAMSTYYKGGVKVWSLAGHYVPEAKRRGLTCGVKDSRTIATNISDVKLCKLATYILQGQRIWNRSSQHAIAEAKRQGLDCGVKNIRTIATNISDVKLCKLATYILQGQRIWNRSSHHAIAEAKRRGLSCSVTKSTLTGTSSSSSGNCSSNIKACSQKELCFEGTFINHAGLSTWQNNAEAKEAKRRGLNCDVLANTAYRIKKNCTEDVKVCTEASLCSFAAKGDSDSRKWNPYWPAHVTEAKLRGVSCGIRITFKNAFRGESVLKRKQIQYALKKLNYYTSSIDALYGPGTERALTVYANAKGLNGHSPHSIFSSVLSQVSVPSSFAVAKRSNNSSSSSSSSSSGGSSAGKTLLQGLFVAGACSLTSNPGACLDGATGNNRSSNTRSSSPKTLSSGTWIKSGNTYIGPGGEAVFDNGRVIQGTDGSLCHRTRNAIICQ